MVEFGEQLRRAREEKGMTQQSLILKPRKKVLYVWKVKTMLLKTAM